MEWTYCIGSKTVLLEHKPLRSVLAIAFITWRPLEWVLLRIWGGYSVWNRIILWAENKAVLQLELPITEAQKELLSGRDWDNSWDSDASVVEFSKKEKKQAEKNKKMTGGEYS